VTQSILDKVRVESAKVSLGTRTADVRVAHVPSGFNQNTMGPALGRPLMGADFTGAPTVCLISFSLWERFGSGASDAPLLLGDLSLEVVGVMPDEFDIPAGTAVWIPQ